MLHIPSPNYRPGRLRPIRVVVLHTAQVPCETGRAVGVANYLATPGVQASCHYSLDPDTTVAQVDEANTAWATPSVNADGLQIEQAGYAEFGSGNTIPETNKAARQAYGSTWPGWDRAEPQRMLRTQTVPLVADLCRRHNLPAVLLEPVDLLDPNTRGITDHVRCSRAFGGDHWDCGPHYPLQAVVDNVAALLAGEPGQPIPPSQEDTVTRLIRNAKDGSLWWWDGHTRAPVGVLAGDTWETLERRLTDLIALHPSADMWPAGTTAAGAPASLFVDLEDWDLQAIPRCGA